MTNLETALVFTLKHEGGYVNNPNDPGGETNFGISKREYPNLDIKNLTKDQVVSIYKQDYWDKVDGDSLELPLGVCVFDTAVLMGVKQAKTFLDQTQDPVEYTALRRDKHYAQAAANPTKLNRFLNGWLNRVVDLRKYIDVLKNEGADMTSVIKVSPPPSV